MKHKSKVLISLLLAAAMILVATSVSFGVDDNSIAGTTGNATETGARLAESIPEEPYAEEATAPDEGNGEEQPAEETTPEPELPEIPDTGSDKPDSEVTEAPSEESATPGAPEIDLSDKTEAESSDQSEEEEDDEKTAEDDLPEGPEEDIALLNAYGYEVLEDGVSAIVVDFPQLKDAIEGDNGIANVYLGADITLEQNRTTIPATKPEFKLSGTNPHTGVRHTITEYNTTALANIVVPNGNSVTKRVTMEDMTIVNQGDYYGLIGVEDGNRGVEMVARNIDFTGRQFAYNVYGHLIFEGNNNINIAAATSGVAGQELAEALHVTVRGSLNVDFQSTYPVFKMNLGAGTFNVEGSFTLNAPRISAANAVIQSAAGANAVNINIAPGANAHMTASARLVNDIANNLTVGAGATFHYERTGGSYAALKLRQKLTVGEGATFYFGQNGSAAGYLLRFDDVPAGMGGGVMEFHNPKLATLADGGSYGMVYGIRNEQFNVTTQYMDYWNSAGGDPAYSFTRANVPEGEAISIAMVHRAGIATGLDTNNSEITADKLKLDKTAKKIVFGQESGPVIREATLHFAAQHEETGEVIDGFEMEEITVEMGVETRVTPQETPGYIPTGYAVDGGEKQPLQDGAATVTAEAETVQVVFYYIEPIVEVSVPVKMIFAAYESDGGAVTSPTFNFENHSRFDVDVSLSSVSYAAKNGENIALAGQGEEYENERLWLAITPTDTERFNTVDMVDPQGGQKYIGKLAGRDDAAGRVMDFILDGRYYGSFEGDGKWPAYNAEFVFEISQEERKI